MANHLDDLAAHLASNYLAISVKESDASGFLKNPQTAPNPNPARVVLVLGAGASAAAAGLPLGEQAADELERRLSQVSPRLIKQEIERLSIEYRLKPGDFETRLLAMSYFDSAGLMGGLFDIFNRRHYPSVVYETISHLLKHRFIDAVINFNFDELLDQALDDEIGPGNYYRIVTDGDCTDRIEEMMDRQRFHLPLYIKPHGTASHKTSMRFTRGAYFLLPTDIRRLIEKLFNELPTCLVAIGYKMESFEFNDLIEKNMARGSKIYSINTHPLSELPKRMMSYYADRHIGIKKNNLGATLDRLWRTCSGRFVKSNCPRGITRHNLIGKVFGRTIKWNMPERENTTQTKAYLLSRTYVELALAVAKAKGIVTLRDLALGRAGAYFKHYRQISRDREASLLDFCEKLGLKPIGYSGEALRLNLGQSAHCSPYTLIIPSGEFKSIQEKLFKKTHELVSPAFQGPLEDVKEQFLTALSHMYKGHEVEISIRAEADVELFRAPELLKTRASLDHRTRQLLQDQKWDFVLSVAETGQWLLDKEIRNLIGRKGLAIIVADETYAGDIKTKYTNHHVQVQVMPWWLHNQHMTLMLRNGEVGKGIVFPRRLRSSRIIPIELGREDCRFLYDVFIAYWLKAEHYRANGTTATVSTVDIDDHKRRIIDSLYDKHRLDD